ncbi:MAG: hypothetical protein AAB652_02780 [Patescibacteria group bacterium]
MKSNYAPWAIDIVVFPKEGAIEDQLRFLLGFAILAPSGHNSQLWSFKIQALISLDEKLIPNYGSTVSRKKRLRSANGFRKIFGL